MVHWEGIMEGLLEWVCSGHGVADLFDQRLTSKISGRQSPRERSQGLISVRVQNISHRLQHLSNIIRFADKAPGPRFNGLFAQSFG